MTGTLSDLSLVFLSQHPGLAAAVLEQVDADEAAQALLPLEVRRASQVLMRNLMIYGVGGLVVPFVGIKLLDMAITAIGLS